MNKELMVSLFTTDKELLNTYHIESPASAEVCAERTFSDMKKAGCKVHLIEKNNEVIGFYGIEGKNFLTGFFLTPENRNTSTIDLFWKKVESHFDKDYHIGIYKKNTRAEKFLERKTNIKHEIQDIVLFTVKR